MGQRNIRWRLHTHSCAAVLAVLLAAAGLAEGAQLAPTPPPSRAPSLPI
jgi:hypothetical protein